MHPLADFEELRNDMRQFRDRVFEALAQQAIRIEGLEYQLKQLTEAKQQAKPEKTAATRAS